MYKMRCIKCHSVETVTFFICGHIINKKGISMRFLDLCDKEVININNCCYLGHVRDMEFDECSGCICAIIVPGPGKYMGCFCREEEYIIPWCNIVRIGPDIVLVNLKDEMRHKI